MGEGEKGAGGTEWRIFIRSSKLYQHIHLCLLTYYVRHIQESHVFSHDKNFNVVTHQIKRAYLILSVQVFFTCIISKNVILK